MDTGVDNSALVGMEKTLVLRSWPHRGNISSNLLSQSTKTARPRGSTELRPYAKKDRTRSSQRPCDQSFNSSKDNGQTLDSEAVREMKTGVSL